MKNFTRRRILIGLAILITGFAFTSCLGIKGMFSDGQDDIQKANELWGKGQQLEALVHATQAVITDPVFIQGKSYLNDYFNQGIANATQRLSAIEKPKNSQEAEEKYRMYDQLVKIYDNLQKIKLPLAHPKGKWSWTTEIIDYVPQRDVAYAEAFAILMEEGREFVKNENVPDAENRFMNASNNYSGTQKDSVKQVIANELCQAAAPLSKMNDVDKVIVANAMYKSALKFVSGLAEATEGVQQTITHISDLYLKRGKATEAKGKVEDFIASIQYYKLAVKWNGGNTEAKESITKVTERIAEYYYQQGLNAQNVLKDPTKAVAMFEETRKWIDNYKDAMSRIYTIRIVVKIEELAANLAETQSEFGKIHGKIDAVSANVDQCDDIMTKLTYISDKSRSMNETMKQTSRTLKVFTVIPTVGTVTGILARSVDLVQEPVGKVATKFTALEQPVITPTKTVVTKTKTVVDNVKGKMGSTETVLNTTREYSLKLKDCVAGITVEKNFKEAENALDEVNKGLVATNKALKEINSTATKIDNEAKKLGKLAGPVSQVTNGIKEVDKVIRKIQPIVDDLNGILDKKFTVNLLVKKFTFSVKQILTGLPSEVKAVMGKFSDLAMGVVKPVLKKFDIKIPEIPGIGKLADELDNIKSSYETFKGELSGFENSVSDFAKAQTKISANLKKIESSTGCQFGTAGAK